MARIPLIHIPNGIYSVVSKCNNDEFLFDSKEKFELYLRHQIECKEIFGFTIYDMVCMSNHVHELYRVPEKATIADILQRVKGGYSQKFNSIFGRKGHFWINKPYYRIVENEAYAIASMNYFHWNPVKAGLVNRPENWPFSGYTFHIYGQRDTLIGKLLDPFPGFDDIKLDEKTMKTTEKILKSKRKRFIGSIGFQKSMRSKYGTGSL